jgi:hypothetical protein
MLARLAPELFTPENAALRANLEFRPYRGIESDILLYLPKPTEQCAGIDNMVAALDWMRHSSPIDYVFVEDCIRGVCPSAENHNYVDSSTSIVYACPTTLERRVWCAVTLIHEASHQSLGGKCMQPKEEHEACYEREADCLDRLGKDAWDELRLGSSDRGFYVGLRMLGCEIGEMHREQEKAGSVSENK